MLAKYKTEIHMVYTLHEENRLAMTIVHLVDYILKWLLALVH